MSVKEKNTKHSDWLPKIKEEILFTAINVATHCSRTFSCCTSVIKMFCQLIYFETHCVQPLYTIQIIYRDVCLERQKTSMFIL